MALTQLNSTLYLGAESDLAAAIVAGVTAIVNVAADVNYVPPDGVLYDKIGLVDGHGNSCSQFSAATDAIQAFVAAGNKTLIHCHFGINRGPAMAVLYYHLFLGMSLTDALAYITLVHPDTGIWPELWDDINACYPGQQEIASCPSVECCPDSLWVGPPAAGVVYWNIEQCATAYCPVGMVGNPVTKCKAANLYYSYESVAAANAAAYAAALAEAEAELSCQNPPMVFHNIIQCATALCPDGIGSNTFCTPAGMFSSTDSQNAADRLAMDYAIQQAPLGLNCVAASLSGLRWELPCDGAGVCGPGDVVTTTMNGDPSIVYDVTLRFRGFVEHKVYIGGSWPNPTKPFYVGGGPNDALWYGVNEYSLHIYNPNQTYWLNFNPVGLTVGADDYTVTIPIRGGSLVELVWRSKDNLEATNPGTVVPGVPPDPLPYPGQFIQMDVISVVPT